MTSDPPTSPRIHIKTRPVDYAARKRRLVIMLLAYSAVLGVIGVFLPEEDAMVDFLAGLPLLVMGIAWCYADANVRQHRVGRLMGSLLVLMFLVGFPSYILQTRGLRGFKTLALAALLVAAMFACLMLTGLAALHLGEALGFIELAEY